MLVLTRKANEEIVVPKLGLRLKIVQISGRRVKLAINAPPSVSVMRAEVTENHELSRSAEAMSAASDQSFSVS